MITRIRTKVILVLIIGIASSAIAKYCLAGERRFEGDKLYTPTRIEWLCVDLNSIASTELNQETQYSLHFTYNGNNPNTIIIFVRYYPNMDRSRLNLVINNAKELAVITAKRYRWQSWLKIAEDVQMEKTEK